MAAYTLHAVLAKSTDYGWRRHLMSAEIRGAANSYVFRPLSDACDLNLL
jgi:hypothetical protein